MVFKSVNCFVETCPFSVVEFGNLKCRREGNGKQREGGASVAPCPGYY